MLERFQERRVVIDAIERQPFVANNRPLAERLAGCSKIDGWKPGDSIITQDGTDRDIYLILAGSVSIQVNGREQAIRVAGQHIGEMSLIDAHRRRVASVLAIEPTVTAKITEPDFTSIANEYPNMWRRLASEIADRLGQRNRYVRPRNEIARLFVGSSRESLSILNALIAQFDARHVICQPWTVDVFGASSFPADDLEDQLARSDFAALIVGADDTVTSRGKRMPAPRDNVIFELGLFMGALGRKRTFLVAERGLQLKIPSDLLGLTPTSYMAGDPMNLVIRIEEAAAAIRKRIDALGPF